MTPQRKAMWLNVNQLCNYRCRWCYRRGSGYAHNVVMSLEIAQQLCIIAQGIGVRHVLVIGGEPTLWKHLLAFNRMCRDRGLHTILVTNAAAFGNDKYWEKYLQAPNDAVGISVKAGTQEQLKEVAGVGNFEQVRRGITRAVQHFRCGVNITYNSFYYGKLAQLADFAMSCGARRVEIDFCSTVFIGGKAASTYMVPPAKLVQDVLSSYPELERITSGHLAFEMELPLCLWPREFIRELRDEGRISSVCHVFKRQGIVFGIDGSVLGCNALFDFPLGRFGQDFHDSASLQQFLESERVRQYCERISCYPSTECQTCDWYAWCGGGCPLRWAIYHPDQLIKPVHEGEGDEYGRNTV